MYSLHRWREWLSQGNAGSDKFIFKLIERFPFVSVWID